MDKEELINQMYSGLMVYSKYVAFWGSAFSNFFPCNFVYDGVEWNCSEQCFMAMKAKHFNDEEIYAKILDAKTPKEAKKLGREVKNFDDTEWSKVRFNYMYEIVKEKFKQNDYLLEFLKNDDFKDKKFVEGSPIDGIWGVKIDYRNDSVNDERFWKGENLLGKVLDKVREEL